MQSKCNNIPNGSLKNIQRFESAPLTLRDFNISHLLQDNGAGLNYIGYC